jgi:hypothetical protein
MKPLLIIALILLINPLNSVSQIKKGSIPKNVISLESGIWSRGLLGVSYSRNIFINKKVHFSADASAGAGVNLRCREENIFLTLNPMINLGNGTTFFMIGFETKYYQLNTANTWYNWWNDKLETNKFYYQGITASPVVGISSFHGEHFVFKSRFSTLIFRTENNNTKWRPSVGFSMGYSF